MDKILTKDTILKIDNNSYQAVEVDNIVYWIDHEANIEEKYPQLVLEQLTTGEYILFQIDNIHDIDRRNQHVILAQSEPRILSIPVITPEVDSWIISVNLFMEAENRKPNLNTDRDLLIVSAIHLGVTYNLKQNYLNYNPIVVKQEIKLIEVESESFRTYKIEI
jgi:hypothetical protein